MVSMRRGMIYDSSRIQNILYYIATVTLFLFMGNYLSVWE